MRLVMNLEKHFIYLPRSLEITFVLLAAWLVAGYITDTTDHHTPLISIEQQQTENTPVRHLDTALFGKLAPSVKTQTAVVTPQPVIQVPVVVSRLNITLIGTIVAGERSAAIVIMNNKRKQQFFILHATMQPNVTLEKVETNAIVVNHHGKSERITLKKGKTLSGASIATKSIVSAPRPHYQPRRMIRRSHLNQQMRNFPKLLSQARVVPHFSQGKSDGFTIMEIVPGSLYEQIGLQNGDVIHKVNGQAVTSAEQAMTMYQTLQHASSIDLELLRGGSIVPIHYQIQ
ncbi:MAG: type II secretion system protein N [Mariprofundaceae bacterium]|nr:type II secretion system protein N [Mariprofundaceae bacterium]